MHMRLAHVVRVTLVAAVLVAGTQPAGAQSTGGAVSVATAGRFARGGEFTGTATINRFVQRGGEIVAVGVVRGTLSRGGRQLGSVLANEVTWPVRLQAGNVSPIKGSASAPRIEQARWMLAQAEICPVLTIILQSSSVDLLGVNVQLSPIVVELRGVVGEPLGDLVCEVSELIGNVAGLVGLLNSILGLLTGLLGGLLPAL